MNAHPRPPKDTKTRQGVTVATGWAGVVVGLILLFASLRLHSAGFMPYAGAAIACSSYCVLARPFISSGDHGIVISNVVREVSLPWEGVSHATSRGSLIVHDTEGHKVTVWAVGSRKAGGPRSTFVSRDDDDSADGSSPTFTLPTDSPQAMREAINAETVDNPDGPSHRVVRWLPLPCALITIAVAALVVGVLR